MPVVAGPDVTLIESIAVVVLAAAAPPIGEAVLRRIDCTATNFRGANIPQSFGVVVLCTATLLIALDAALRPVERSRDLLWIGCIAAFSLLGLLDDVLGDRTVKG